MRKKLIGELLIEQGLINEEQLKEGLARQSVLGMRLGDVLVHLGYVREQDVAACLEMAQPDLISMNIDAAVIAAIPLDFMRLHLVFPLRFDEHQFWVAMVDPSRLDVIDELGFLLRKKISPVLCRAHDLERALDYYFSATPRKTSDSTFQSDDMSREMKGLVASLGQESDKDQEGPISQLAALLLKEALRQRASDIHLEPLPDKFRLRYRVDGLMQEVTGPPQHLQNSIISRLKLMAGMDLAEKRLPQDGRLSFVYDKDAVDFRVSSMPCSDGESLVLRVLDQKPLSYSLNDLGFGEDDRSIMQKLLASPNGVILVTGPTGSGKTTTLYAALRTLAGPNKKIITVEDPVEYRFEGINQVQVNSQVGLSFARALRSILRQSPEILMIGEIRDLETADTTVQASLTGHLVFSTLHTNDAPGAITRLRDMGVKSYLIASSLQAVVAQRLVRKVCLACKQAYSALPEECRILGLSENHSVTLFRGKGCDQCLGTGYRGRIGLFQIMVVDEVLRELIFAEESAARIEERARNKGMQSLKQDGFQKVLAGWTTLDEVFRVTELDPQE